MKISFIALPALSLLASCARAECTYPKAPEKVPNGYTATQTEMTKATQDFKSFNSAMTAYLACLDRQTADTIAKGGKDLTPEQIKQINDEAAKKNDTAVDELQAHVDEFNTEVRAFNVIHK